MVIVVNYKKNSFAEHQLGLRFDTSVLDQFTVPPDILSYLSRRLAASTKPFPDLRSLGTHPSELGAVRTCYQTKLICEIYDLLAEATSPLSPGILASKGLLHMVAEGLDNAWLADLPTGIAVPLLEMNRACQTNPMPDWPAQMYAFIGRSDLAMQCLGEMSESRDLATAEVSRFCSITLTLDRWRDDTHCRPTEVLRSRQLQQG